MYFVWPSCNISTTRASVSSGYPNTEKQMKARGRRPSVFIVSRLIWASQSRIISNTDNEPFTDKQNLFAFVSKSLWLASSWLFTIRQKCHISSQTIYGHASICTGVLFSRATELPLESSCFDCLKSVERKILSGFAQASTLTSGR